MKKKFALIIAVCMLFSLSACGTEYEDTNGDDITLQTITDEDIINLSIGASGLTYKETNLGGLKSS